MESSGVGQSVTNYFLKEKGKFKVWDMVYYEYRKYTEDIENQDWNIVADSVRTILGYECILATTAYHGRQWDAWFAPEIPINAGPWKLLGLPGLILEAEEEGSQYSFIATGIQQTVKPITPVYLADEYEHTTRIDYLKSKRAFMDNPVGKINAQFGGAGVTIIRSDGDDSKNLYVPAAVADFLETDYH